MLLHNPDDFVGGMTGDCRGEKEVEAESTAFLAAAHVGLDTSDYTFGYVTGWAEQAVSTTGKAPHEIVQATGARVVRAAAQLTTALDEALGHGEPPVPAQLAQRGRRRHRRAATVRAQAERAGRRRPGAARPVRHTTRRRPRFPATAGPNPPTAPARRPPPVPRRPPSRPPSASMNPTRDAHPPGPAGAAPHGDRQGG